MKVCIVCGHLGWCFECFAHRHKFYRYPPPPKPKYMRGEDAENKADSLYAKEYLAIVEVIKIHFGLK